MPAHGLEQVEGADEVVGVVLQGLSHALAHRLQPGEVDHRVNVRVLGKERFYLGLAAQLGLDKGDGLAHDFLHPAEGFLAGVVQIVGHHNVVARLNELHAGVTADVAGAAADQNRHNDRSFLK